MNIFSERERNTEAGFYGLYQRFENVAIYLLFFTSLSLALSLIGTLHWAEPLSLPLALSFAMIAALRFRMTAVIVITAITVVVVGVFYFLDLGAFGTPELTYPALFSLGLITLFLIASCIVAVVTGYHMQTVSLSARRENMLHKVFDALPIGIWVRTRNGETVFLNDRWASFSSKDKEYWMREDFTVAPVRLGTLWERSVCEVLDAEDGAIRYQTVELTDRSGRELSMTLLTLHIYIDQLEDYGTLSLLVDETALRIYEDKVRTSEDSLRFALDNAEMGFWDQNLETREITCDLNWLKILGLDDEPGLDLLETWKTRIHPDDSARVTEVYKRYFESGGHSVCVTYRIRKGQQKYIWVQDYVGVVERAADGSIKRIIGTMQDITERKQFELDLKHAKERAEAASEAKGQFIATISHEIRTPLNAIIGLSSFLAESEMPEDQLDLAQTIYSSGKSLLMLVNDILDFSKIESGRLDLEMQEYPLRLCFEECVKLFKVRANEKDVTLSLNLADSLTEYAIGDMERLRQIVQNLLANALKFTDSGEVEICVRPVAVSDLPEDRRPDPFEPIGYLDQADHGYLEVLVKDSGIGIPEERQHILFKAFSQVDASTTRKYGGTGLGLAISKRLVDGMGGKIWLESNDGEGATFGFVVRTYLVADEDAESPVSSDGHALEQPVKRISEQHPCDILVVGDHSDTTVLLKAFRQLGYAPHHSLEYDLSSGAFIRRHYNLIFIWMDDEDRALELTRQICNNAGIKKTASIIGCAPAGRRVSDKRCNLSGMQAVVDAPIGPAELSEVILTTLGVHG